MKTENSKTIVFLSGAFLSHAIWDDWQHYFKSKGYTIHAPWWPHKDAPPEVLVRKHPDPELGVLRLDGLIHYFESYLKKLPEKPIVIGEGLAGALVQLLAQKQLIAAGVLINTWPANGFLPTRREPLALFFNMLGSLRLRSSYLMDFDQWDHLTQDQPDGYRKCYRYVIPESRKLIWDMLFGRRIHYNKVMVPLLFIATENPMVSATSQYKIFRRYVFKNPRNTYKSFPDTEFPSAVCRLQEDIAEYINLWLSDITRD